MSRLATNKLKAIFLGDMMVVGLAIVGFCYVETLRISFIKPAEFVLTDFTIFPSEVEIGEPVTISVNVTNIGDEAGNCSLTLFVDGEVKENRTVQLSGAESTLINFTVTAVTEGLHIVKLGNFTGNFNVTATTLLSYVTMSNLIVSPYESWVGDTIKIRAVVSNENDAPIVYSIPLVIDGTLRETKTVRLIGKTSMNIEFTVIAESEGIHRFKLGTLNGAFKVVPTGMHTLTIASSASNLEFKLDGETKKVPFSALLNVGKHVIAVPPTSPDGKAVFLRWEDGSTDPTREINLESPMYLIAYYSGGSSCPSLFVWNGNSLVYVAEISNHGWLGYINYITNDPDWPIVYWRNNPWDYLKLDRSQLWLVNGSYYEMVLSQRWNEIFYLDAAYLVVVDHPADVDVYSTGVEQYLDPEYMGKIYTVSKNPLAPVSAFNEKGEDVLSKILYMDGVFTPGSNGLLSPSWNNISWNRLTVDLGNLSGAEQIKLIVTGKVDWGSPENYTAWIEKFFAAEVPNGTQVTPPPYMEVMDKNGNWVMVPWERQFPLPTDVNSRTWVVDLTGLFPADIGKYVIRISNFWNVTFDYIGVDVSPQKDVIIQSIYPYATLYQEFESPSKAYGNFTRYGDVTSLVLSYDDEFVIGRQGDAVRLIFPVGNLTPPAEGMDRDFFLFVACWFKDETGNWGYGFDFTVDPLPFQNMSGFPYPLDKESYPYELHWDYITTYNTRVIKPKDNET